MEIRKFQKGDEKELWKLFYNTIHNVNIRDYNNDQINAWAPQSLDINIAKDKFREISPFIVTKNGIIVGYADIQDDGYIDHFYCHYKYQRHGIGSKLFAAILKEAIKKGISLMYSNVSITARPFFEAKGFIVEKEQILQLKGQKLKNYRMVRRIDQS